MAVYHHTGAAAPGLAAPQLAEFPAVDLKAGHKDEARELWGSSAGFRGQGKSDACDSPGALVLGQAAIAIGLTITSRDIAELTGKRHDHVLRDARKMLAELYGEGGLPSFGATLVEPQNGQEYPALRLPKRETLILVSGYSVTMRARIIDRWQHLEAQAEKSRHPAVPTSFREALLLAAEQQEVIERQATALAVAAPKADALDRIATLSEGAVSVRAAANLADVPQGQFVAFLIEQGWLYRDRDHRGLMAKADKLRAGLVETKRVEVPRPGGKPMAVARVLITTRGVAKLAELIERKAPHLRNSKARRGGQQVQLALQIAPANEQEGCAP